MTLNPEEREQLIRYNIEKSHQAIEDVEFLLDNDRPHLAITRIYYGTFYILSALALKHQFSTKKHKELIGWFNKNFIRNNLVDKKISKIIRLSFELRSEADYDVTASFTKEEVENYFVDMKKVINSVEGLLEEK
ncbi:MAG: HEPN domain-containing protein [bacterium]|nr:HEPN domain-containing protein [bacterium]